MSKYAGAFFIFLTALAAFFGAYWGTQAAINGLNNDPGVDVALKSIHSFEPSHPHATKASVPEETAQAAYLRAMDEMHGPMMEGIRHEDPDMAFALGMIPHHVGAVDMADIQLTYGKDPEMRELARNILHAQHSEIEQMRNWLKKNGYDPDAATQEHDHGMHHGAHH